MFAKVRVVTRRRDGAAFAAKVFKKRAELSDGNELSRARSAALLARSACSAASRRARRACASRASSRRPASSSSSRSSAAAATSCTTSRASASSRPRRRYFRTRAPSRCHAVSVAHRDVKPENMLVAFDGRRRARVRLSDFGSACVFAGRPLAARRVPFWSSPEAWALDYDHRGDVYSVGVVLLVLVDGMLGGDEVRALHGAGLAGLVDYSGSTGPAAGPLRGARPAAGPARGPPRARGGPALRGRGAREPVARGAAAVASRTGAGVLAQRRAERAARAALVAVADGAARRRVRPRSATRRACPGCAALGELAAAAERAAPRRAPRAPRDAGPRPRAPALRARGARDARAGRRAASALTGPAARAPAARAQRRRPRTRAPRRGAGTGPAAPPAVGRRNAPGADGGGAISMDGTYSGLVGIFADDGGDVSDASLHGLAAFEDRAGDADRAT
ncbi:serine/threonine kinase [Aureococcus anophagefferens]|nr:serine/threonine kinase [Aureococcus anophagefferens]